MVGYSDLMLKYYNFNDSAYYNQRSVRDLINSVGLDYNLFMNESFGEVY